MNALHVEGTLYTMGGGKLGQLGIGRAVESCTEPKTVHIAGGTCYKVVRGSDIEHVFRTFITTNSVVRL